jgi:hypothetical protein
MKTVMVLGALVGAMFVIGSAVAQQQITGTGEFCVKGPTGPIKCEYGSMAQCQQGRPQNENDQCISRSQAEGSVGGPRSNPRDLAPAPGEQKD